jgi:hypothetical protein
MEVAGANSDVNAIALGKPEEYASLVVYLASEEHYLVGQIAGVKGGT